MRYVFAVFSLILAGACLPVAAQTPGATAPAGQPAAARQRPPQLVSPEVGMDRRVTFRILAPQSEDVRFSSSDLPGITAGGVMKKDDRGVWELTLGPVEPGAHRYQFRVNGVAVVDPGNPSASESLSSNSSLVVVPGSEWMDTKDVSHGAVASVTYHSAALGQFRRMQVYTPPGYEKGRDTYPVFYLLHGAGDSDASWKSVGRAGFILDNLIATGKARPMIVVMPAGHASYASPPSSTPPADAFVTDFTREIMPYIESHYRTKNDRQSRAIAGLSMGGFQTLNIAIPKLDAFAYVGVFSSGLFGIVPRPSSSAPPAPFRWEEQNAAKLDDAGLRKGLKVFWFATGKDDFLLDTTRATVDMFKKHGFPVEFKESGGGHAWANWRDYLIEFAPRLFPG
jgi:enterochelin esterase-like enzyme